MPDEINGSSLRLRGTCANGDRGRKAELFAAQYFRNRGYQVEDCAHFNHQYDLIVSGYGRVQVKCVSLHKKHKNRGASLNLQCFMGSSTAGYYSSDAFDWLCMVWLTSKSAWIVLRNQQQCLHGSDPRRMKSCFSIGLTKFRNLMQSVDSQEITLFEMQ